MVNYDLFDGILFFDIKQLLMNNVKKKGKWISEICLKSRTELYVYMISTM